jgi:hypothetical protein
MFNINTFNYNNKKVFIHQIIIFIPQIILFLVLILSMIIKIIIFVP